MEVQVAACPACTFKCIPVAEGALIAHHVHVGNVSYECPGSGAAVE